MYARSRINMMLSERFIQTNNLLPGYSNPLMVSPKLASTRRGGRLTKHILPKTAPREKERESGASSSVSTCTGAHQVPLRPLLCATGVERQKLVGRRKENRF